MRNRKLTILLTGLIFVISAFCVYGASQTSVTYEMKTGKVQIHMETFTERNGKEEVWKEDKDILPGAVLSKIPRIYNDGAECYVRAKVDFICNKNTKKNLTMKNIRGISNKWKQAGEYYYLKDSLRTGENVNFFTGICIPGEWEQEEGDGDSWDVKIQAEAIQTENFRPDFDSDDPWNVKREKVEIVKATEGTVSGKKENNSKVQLEIEKDLEGFSVRESEMFRVMETFMPGSTHTGQIELTNHTGKERNVYFRTEADEANDLLKQMELTVSIAEGDHIHILYQGPLVTDRFREQQLLKAVAEGKTEKMEFKVRLPREADNKYSAKEGKIKIFFTTDRPAKEVLTRDMTSSTPFICMGAAIVLMAVGCWGMVSHRRGKTYGRNR